MEEFNPRRFYADLLDELAAHARRGGTAIGAGAVAKRVALDHHLDYANDLPIPRMSRSEMQAMGTWHGTKAWPE